MARDERGLSESVQWAVLWPLLMLLTLGIIQAGIFLHGRNVAQRAATAAVDVARGSYGSAADAEHLGESIASSGGLKSISVRVQRTGTAVTADVSAYPPMIFDLDLGRINETAVAPLERVTQP
ncbi:MAG TPA: TadE/TadG family type IV pilus assembly protein [Propionibacteriaceae bacterium]|jgi:Flp pilus assembly protein TadG|nr:TadE/TadG family type IV pilus assembly protein [Propionibacteriaceae bacterium]